MDSDLAWVNGKSGRQSWRYHADAFQRSIISEAIYHFTILQWPSIRCLSGDASPPRKIASSSPNFNTMVPKFVSIQIIIEVKVKGKVKGHEMWELLCVKNIATSRQHTVTSRPKFHTRSSVFARYLTSDFITASEADDCRSNYSKVDNWNEPHRQWQSAVHDISVVWTTGVFMVGITALDSDAGLNGQVEYHLNTSNDYFSINATTGVIVTRQTLTSNMSSQGFNLIATAADKVRTSCQCLCCLFDGDLVEWWARYIVKGSRIRFRRRSEACFCRQ